MLKRVLLASLVFAAPAYAQVVPFGLPVVAHTNSGNSVVVSDASGSGETNYPLQFGRPFIDGAIPHAPQVLINGAAAASQADVKNRYPDGSVEFAVVATVIPAVPANGSVTLTFQDTTTNSNTPLTTAQMLAAGYNFDADVTLAPNSGAAASFSGDAWNARTMLTNGDCKPWTAGPVAQTMICADDTVARKYDIGFGDGFHPLRPRYFATFWPATNQVYVRVAVENDNTQEIEDAGYKPTITLGSVSPQTVYTGDLSGTQSTSPKVDWSQTAWTKTFWIGGTPQAEVNIDNNLTYLKSTRFFPNWDTTIAINPATLTSFYSQWTGQPHDIYDGDWDGGIWTSAMQTAGGRNDIGTMPTWTVLWLYTGDWRMRQMSLGLSDLAASWVYHLREGSTTRKLLRTDVAGTGLGHPVSLIGRPTLDVWNAGGDYGTADVPVVVGTVNLNEPWNAFETSHAPDVFFAPYILTGDPWYLGEEQMWTAYEALRYNAAPNSACSYCRGPDGTYGMIADELRGDGWGLRDRAEAAFASPDGDPFKTYLGTLVNDYLAGYEGELGITGTAYTGSLMQTWGAAGGDNLTINGGPENGKVPPMFNWESDGSPAAGQDPPVATQEQNGTFIPGKVGSFTASWMQYYVDYSLNRATELGFAAGPLAKYTGQYLISLINTSGMPTMIEMYEPPTEPVGGGFFTTWAQVFANFEPSYLTGVGQAPGATEPIPAIFAGKYNADYAALAVAGLAGLVDQNASGAATAWAWLYPNVYQPIATTTFESGTATWAYNPQFAIVPRTDTNVLPAQPTTLQ